MTSRHTISHADELYAGNAFKSGYSPDGRRGIRMTHLYAHRFLSTAGASPIAGDPDGFTCILPTGVATTWKADAELLPLMSGPLCSSVAATVANFDVPRNVRWSACNAVTALYLKVLGRDQYGETMCENIRGLGAGVVASGMKMFKKVDSITVCGSWNAASIVIIGSGNKLGLPFNLSAKGNLISVSQDGYSFVPSGVTGEAIYTIAIGASAATTMTSCGGTPDARGFIRFISPVPDGTIQMTALMVVDPSTERTAFGPPQVTVATAGV